MDPANANGQGIAHPVVNGSAPLVKRRVKKLVANPFASARQPGKTTLPNGQPFSVRSDAHAAPTPQRVASPVKFDPNSTKHSGFSDPLVTTHGKQYTDYRLVASKKELLAGLRYHMLQLIDGKEQVDVLNSDHFPRPAHLHRRDPRAAPVEANDEQIDLKDGMTAQERLETKEKNEQRKLEREANQRLIAPTQSTRKPGNNKTKTRAVYKRDFTEEEKRRIQTNYEETLPWHLEDIDEKHCLVSENQGASARRHVAFVYEPPVDANTARFRIVPVEKVYEFQEKKRDHPRTETTIEEAEARMKKPAVVPEWLERAEHKILDRKKKEILDRGPRLYTGERATNKYSGRTGEDVDLDFDDDDLFADDEEGDMFRVKDEDEALADKRIREDQLKANYFDVKEEAEYDQEEEEEKKEEEDRKANFRRVRRALEKHEHNYNHGSDSEYSSSSEDEEAAAERERQDAEKQKTLSASLQADGKLAATASGATTPSGRKEKTPVLLSDREGGKTKNKLKRPGSPNLSEAGSGTDTSTRNKKPKMKHTASNQSLSHPDSPSATKLRTRNPGAGSDTDANASDARPGRIKLKHNSSGIPSRVASPAPTGPASAAIRGGAVSPPPQRMPTVQELAAVLRQHPNGLDLHDLVTTLPYPKDMNTQYSKMIRSMANIVGLPSGQKNIILDEAKLANVL